MLESPSFSRSVLWISVVALLPLSAPLVATADPTLDATLSGFAPPGSSATDSGSFDLCIAEGRDLISRLRAMPRTLSVDEALHLRLETDF